jgi:hypothetical protein
VGDVPAPGIAGDVPASGIVCEVGGGAVPASSYDSQLQRPEMHSHSSCKNSHSVPSGAEQTTPCIGIIEGQFGSTGSAHAHCPEEQRHSISSYVQTSVCGLHVESSIGRSRGHAVAVMPAAPVPIALGAPLAPPPPPVPERGAAEVMPVPALPTPDGEEVSSAEHASSEPITKFRTNELVFFCMAIGSMTAPRENLQINAIKCRYPRIHSQSSTRSAERSSPAAP